MSRAKTPKKTAASTAIVRVKEREYHGLSMAFAPAEAKRRLQELQAFVQEVMVPDVDFMNVGDDRRPSLLQPGAQKLAEIYGFYPHFVDKEIVKDWERGFFYFEYRCELRSRRDDSIVSEGIGSCNSRESKYAGRWVTATEVPPGMKLETLEKRTEAAWLFDNKLPPGTDRSKLRREERTSKKGKGKYTVYQMVVDQYRMPNPDPFSLVNTLQKMGAKRAYIHAVIGATRSAGLFTQDVEDLPPDVLGKADERRPWEGAATKPEPEESEPQGPREPPPAAAPTDPTSEQVENFKDMMRAVDEAPSLEVLARRWKNTKTGRDHGLITPAQRERLGEIKDRRKAALEAPPPAAPKADRTDDGNEALGIAPAVLEGGEACVHCGEAVGPDAIEVEGPTGALAKKHPTCTAFGKGSIE
jgi:hypothetical protein